MGMHAHLEKGDLPLHECGLDGGAISNAISV